MRWVMLTAGLVLALAGEATAERRLLTGAAQCEGISGQPGFSIAFQTILQDNQFAVERTSADGRSFDWMRGRISADGTVRVEGGYRFDQTERTLEYRGRMEGDRLVASGPRGPRTCRLTFDAPPRAPVVPPYRGLPALGEPRPRARPVPGGFACGEPPTPLRDVLVEPFYRRDDPTGSIIDPDLMAARNQAVAPLEQLNRGLGQIGDAVLNYGGDRRIALCLVRWLNRWAAEGALLGRVTMQGGFERKWSLSAAALNAMVLPADLLATAEGARVRAWLADVAWAMVPVYSNPGSHLGRNNHLNWAVLAALAAGIVAQDRGLVDWAVDRLQFALTQIADDGSLPLELLRGSKALHYHVFTIEPTILTIRLLAENGLDLGADRAHPIHRLAAFVRDSLADPRLIGDRVGRTQDFFGGGQVRGAHYHWAEIYLGRYPDPVLRQALDRHRGNGLSSGFLGGGTSLRFGPP
jgi:poly(beta-D-mannuronate) lyase